MAALNYPRKSISGDTGRIIQGVECTKTFVLGHIGRGQIGNAAPQMICLYTVVHNKHTG
jgi:hypothetical protein